MSVALKVGQRVRIKSGCGDFNNCDVETYQNRIGTVTEINSSGWVGGTVTIRFEDDNSSDLFDSDDVAIIG